MTAQRPQSHRDRAPGGEPDPALATPSPAAAIAQATGAAPSSASFACGAALLIFVAGRCLVPMDETDLFYNLRLGEIVLATHAVPRTNLLSFTAPDFPDPNLAWLFQVVLALAHRAAGIAGTVLLKTAFVVATFGILFRVALRRRAHPALAAAVLALAAWAAEPRFVERPHLVTFLGLAAVLLALERAREPTPRPLLLWMVVPGGLLWANGNSCFFLAPALLALYAAGTWLSAATPEGRQPARRAALVALLLVPLLFATPAGSGWIGYVVNHFRMPSVRPLQEYRVVEWPLDGPFLFLLLALTAVTLFPLSSARRGAPLDGGSLLPILAMALLGSRRIRFVAEFALLAGPYVAAGGTSLIGHLFARAPGRAARASSVWVVPAALLALTLTPRFEAARAGGPVLDLTMEKGLVPGTAIDWLNTHHLRDQLYNDLEVGSYLAWEGWPRHGVFQDPRINAYPEALHAILRRPDLTGPAWDNLMNYFNIQAALITYPDLNPRAALFDPARWALCYQSTEALVFVRRTDVHQALIAAEEIPLSFRFDPSAGTSAIPLNDPPASSPVAACEWSRRRGELEIARQDWEKAGRAFTAALAAGPACLPAAVRDGARERAAMLALRSGEPGRAVRLLAGLTSPAALSNRGFALLQLGQASEALTAFKQVLAMTPDDAEANFGHALALCRVAPRQEAVTALQAFVSRWPKHFAASQARLLLDRLLAQENLSRAGAPSRL